MRKFDPEQIKEELSKPSFSQEDVKTIEEDFKPKSKKEEDVSGKFDISDVEAEIKRERERKIAEKADKKAREVAGKFAKSDEVRKDIESYKESDKKWEELAKKPSEEEWDKFTDEADKTVTKAKTKKMENEEVGEFEDDDITPVEDAPNWSEAMQEIENKNIKTSGESSTASGEVDSGEEDIVIEAQLPPEHEPTLKVEGMEAEAKRVEEAIKGEPTKKVRLSGKEQWNNAMDASPEVVDLDEELKRMESKYDDLAEEYNNLKGFHLFKRRALRKKMSKLEDELDVRRSKEVRGHVV